MHRPVIGLVARRIAPTVRRRDCRAAQQGCGPSLAIGAIEQLAHRISADRRRAVALALMIADAAAAQGAAHPPRAPGGKAAAIDHQIHETILPWLSARKPIDDAGSL